MHQKTDLYGVILAGGGGSRLWPLSREMYPKQLLKLNNENTLFQSTFLRLSQAIPSSNIVTITNVKHLSNIKTQLQELTDFSGNNNSKIIVEPVGRNTAPAIALSVFYILKNLVKEKNDPVIIVAPSDHLIQFESDFIKAVNNGVELAKAGFIVTFGVIPERPDTGFGYINTFKDEEVSNIVSNALKVQEFKEKPDATTAKEYCKQGTYFWNSGIFMFRASTMLNELELHSKDIIKILNQCDFSAKGTTVSFEEYSQLPDISIDYAVMEHSKTIALVPINCGWNDVGCWEAIYDVADKDEKNNFISGNVIDIDSENSLIHSTSKLISTIGLKDIVVIETEDALLVCDKNRTQEVKKIVEFLKKNNDTACVYHRTQYRPWGYTTILQKGEGFMIKTIHMNPHTKQSFHMHSSRIEHWVVVEGNAKVNLGDDIIYLNPGESIDIPPKIKHSLENSSDTDLKIIEVQTGKKFDEEDMIRFEDNFEDICPEK